MLTVKTTNQTTDPDVSRYPGQAEKAALQIYSRDNKESKEEEV